MDHMSWAVLCTTSRHSKVTECHKIICCSWLCAWIGELAAISVASAESACNPCPVVPNRQVLLFPTILHVDVGTRVLVAAMELVPNAIFLSGCLSFGSIPLHTASKGLKWGSGNARDVFMCVGGSLVLSLAAVGLAFARELYQRRQYKQGCRRRATLVGSLCKDGSSGRKGSSCSCSNAAPSSSERSATGAGSGVDSGSGTWHAPLGTDALDVLGSSSTGSDTATTQTGTSIRRRQLNP